MTARNEDAMLAINLLQQRSLHTGVSGAMQEECRELVAAIRDEILQGDRGVESMAVCARLISHLAHLPYQLPS